MRSSLALTLFVLGVAFLLLLLGADPLLAHDCSSIQDCLQTSGYNGVVSVAGGAIAVGAGLLGAHLADPGTDVEEGEDEDEDDDEDEEDEEEDEPQDAGPPNPCQSTLDRFKKARGRKQFAEQSLQTMRSRLAQMDRLYEQTRYQGYHNAAIDIGFLAASTWGGVFTGPVQQMLWEKIAEAAALGVIKDGLKFKVKIDSGDKPTPEDLANMLQGMGKNGRDKLFEEMMAEGLAKGAWDKGAGLPGTPANWAADDVAGPIAKAQFDSLSLVDTLMEASGALEQMEILRKGISNTQQAVHAIEHTLEFDIDPEIGFAQEGIDACQLGDEYQRYLKHLAFLKLPSQG